MERDFFRDRPESVQFNRNLYKGCPVYICLKSMQPKAREISDLTLTCITANLTSAWQHPRGQKIRGIHIRMDRYGNKLYEEEPEEVVGRCTYIVDENLWSMDTSEGKKCVAWVSRKKKIDIVPRDELVGSLKLRCVLTDGRASFSIPIHRHMFFSDVSKAQEFIDGVETNGFRFAEDKILFSVDGMDVCEDKFSMSLDGSRVLSLQDMYPYVDAHGSRGALPLELDGYELEKLL